MGVSEVVTLFSRDKSTFKLGDKIPLPVEGLYYFIERVYNIDEGQIAVAVLRYDDSMMSFQSSSGSSSSSEGGDSQV